MATWQHMVRTTFAPVMMWSGKARSILPSWYQLCNLPTLDLLPALAVSHNSFSQLPRIIWLSLFDNWYHSAAGDVIYHHYHLLSTLRQLTVICNSFNWLLRIIILIGKVKLDQCCHPATYGVIYHYCHPLSVLGQQVAFCNSVNQLSYFSMVMWLGKARSALSSWYQWCNLPLLPSLICPEIAASFP